MKNRNYGLILDEQKKEDWNFGAGKLSVDILVEDGDWTPYLPEKELQNLNDIEPSACVTFTVLNCIEALIKRQYNIDRNYSDRFLAMVSGTTQVGNSPNTVCEFLRKVGVVSQELWPFDKTINSFDKFYSPIPPKLYQLAKEFNEEWEFGHEFVDSRPEMIARALQSSPLLISVPAWFVGDDGKYHRPEGVSDNHATTLIAHKKGEYWRVFDTYDNNIKDVAWGVLPKVVKRFYIKKRIKKEKVSWLQKIHDFFKNLSR